MFYKIAILSLLITSSLIGQMTSTVFSGENTVIKNSLRSNNQNFNNRNTYQAENGQRYTGRPNDRRIQPYSRHAHDTYEAQYAQRYMVNPNDHINSNVRGYTETYQVEDIPNHERFGQNPYEVGYDQVQVDRMKAKRDTTEYLVPSDYQVGGTIDLHNDKDLQTVYYGRKNNTKMTNYKIERSGAWNEPVEISGSIVYTLVNPDRDQRRRKYEKTEVYFENNNMTRTVVIQTN